MNEIAVTPEFLKSTTSSYLFQLLVGLALRGGGAVGSFAITWLIARQFGAEVVGRYQIGFTTASLCGLIATMGLHLVLVREAGRLISAQQFGALAATYKACRRYVLASGLALSVAVTAAAGLVAGFWLSDDSAISFIIAFAPLVVLLPWVRLNCEMLRSIGDVWKSQALEGIFYTGLTAVILMGLWLGDMDYPPLVIAAIYLGSVIFALFLSASTIAGKLAVWGHGAAEISRTDGLVALAPAIIMGGVEWTILLLVGINLSISDAGVYRTLVMYGALLAMISTSFAIMSGPHLARARANNDRKRFFSAVNSASYLGLVVAAPLVVAAVFFAAPILNLFGPEFVKGSAALGILAMSQLVGIAAGPVAPAMIMLHREKPVLHIEIIAAVGSLPLAFVLLREFGLIGPPIAALCASLVRAVYTGWAVRRAWPSVREEAPGPA